MNYSIFKELKKSGKKDEKSSCGYALPFDIIHAVKTNKVNSMSSKFPMVSIDKVEVKLTVKAESVVAVDKISEMSGMSRAAVINGYIEDGLKRAKITLTAEDLARVEEIKAANIARRNAIKAKKGIK